MKNFNPKEFFGDVAEDYARYRGGRPKEFLQKLFIKEMGMKEGDSIVEIGGGPGNTSEILAELGFHVVNVEPDDRARKRHWQSIADRGVPKKIGHYTVLLEKGDSTGTDLERNSAKAIVMADSAYYIDSDENKSMKEFHRILGENGNIVTLFTKENIEDPITKKFMEFIKKDIFPTRGIDTSAVAQYKKVFRYFGSQFLDKKSMKYSEHAFERIFEKQDFIGYVNSFNIPADWDNDTKILAEKKKSLTKFFDENKSDDGKLHMQFKSVAVWGPIKKKMVEAPFVGR